MKRVATIIGAGKYLPEKRVTSQELEEELRFPELGVRKNTIKIINGVKSRHIAAEGEYSSDLATKASQAAIDMAGIEPEEIDLILFCSVSQDFIEPATAYVVQHNLDASNASCFDIKNACNAFITGMEIANLYIEANKADTVLLVSGEIMSRFIKRDYQSKDEINETNATLGFGDAGAAILFRATEIEEDDPYRGMESRLSSYGQYWDRGVIWGGGSRFLAQADKFYMRNLDSDMVQESRARAIFYFYECMQKNGLSVDDVTYFCTSQMSKYAVQGFADAMKIPHDKIATQVEYAGNVGASNIGLGFALSLEKGLLHLRSGERVVFMGAGNGLSLGYASMKLL